MKSDRAEEENEQNGDRKDDRHVHGLARRRDSLNAGKENEQPDGDVAGENGPHDRSIVRLAPTGKVQRFSVVKKLGGGGGVAFGKKLVL